ncbi:flagellin N-terminal helical domain-containing protein [Xaviernesmea oryzae]|uniref:flagellin N-terminal helical domain-containing protein n=1 Tax=Xaviernesmea oryzae TaxID=464029 RepID=UPI0008C58E95|nr:flagellin [Xaviernesmea oryzae]SEL47572.1 flagellin [Xaviernesmea oryzae]
MTSIITNASAIAALSTLRTISSNMESTQAHISSGLKVGSAKDNAAYWSIATTMKSDDKALSAVQDALGLAAAKTDTAYNGLDTTIDIISTIKQKLVTAREPGADKDKINKEITELKNQIISTAQSSSFSGENWLYNTSTTAATTKTMVGSFTRSANGVSIGTISYDTANSVLIDTNDATKGALTKAVTGYGTYTNGTAGSTGTYFLINVNSTTSAAGSVISISSTTTDAQVEQMLSSVDTMLQSLTNAASTLGAANSRIDTQNSFVKDLRDTITKGVGRLVDADMNEESTKLKALQTQQQLGIQALSIANSSADSVLSLFR